MDWTQIGIVAAGAAVLGWSNWDKLKGLFSGLLPASKPIDSTAARVMMALELRAACEKSCPEAIKHIDAAIPHLLPGHVEVSA